MLRKECEICSEEKLEKYDALSILEMNYCRPNYDDTNLKLPDSIFGNYKKKS